MSGQRPLSADDSQYWLMEPEWCKNFLLLCKNLFHVVASIYTVAILFAVRSPVPIREYISIHSLACNSELVFIQELNKLWRGECKLRTSLFIKK